MEILGKVSSTKSPPTKTALDPPSLAIEVKVEREIDKPGLEVLVSTFELYFVYVMFRAPEAKRAKHFCPWQFAVVE